MSNVTTGLIRFRGELLENLNSSYDVTVIAAGNGEEDFFSRIGCTFINTAFDTHGTNPINELKLYKRYVQLIRQINPDIVLTYTIKPNIYGGLACKRLKIPYIVNITGLGDAVENKGLLSFITCALYKAGLEKASMVFFQNRSNSEFFIRKRLFNGSYDVLPGSGVNLKKHEYEPYPDEKPGEPLVLSVVGRITRDKGIKEVLGAAEMLKGKNLIIQLVGSCDGDYSEQIMEAEQNGVIRFVGRQQNVHEWMKNSHAILHASYHEGMSNVLLEAAACGRPVIATNVSGCADTFDEGISGIGFEARNTDALVAAVERFLTLSHEQKEAMGLAGRRKMEASFDRNIVIEKYLRAIKAVLREA